MRGQNSGPARANGIPVNLLLSVTSPHNSPDFSFIWDKTTNNLNLFLIFGCKAIHISPPVEPVTLSNIFSPTLFTPPPPVAHLIMPRTSLHSPTVPGSPSSQRSVPSSQRSLRSATPRQLDSDCDDLTPVWPGQSLLPRPAPPHGDTLPLRLAQRKTSGDQPLQAVGFSNGIRHVPFSGLSLSSGSNGATYQHTVGGYDSTGGVPIIR